MTPNDPSHITAVCRSLRGACYEQCEVTVAPKVPKSGGVAFRVQRGDAVFWLQAKPGRPNRFGGIRYSVRNSRGVDVGPICHVCDHPPLFEAAEHLAMHLEREAPHERAPAPAWLVEGQEKQRAQEYADAQARVAAQQVAS